MKKVIFILFLFFQFNLFSSDRLGVGVSYGSNDFDRNKANIISNSGDIGLVYKGMFDENTSIQIEFNYRFVYENVKIQNIVFKNPLYSFFDLPLQFKYSFSKNKGLADIFIGMNFGFNLNEKKYDYNANYHDNMPLIDLAYILGINIGLSDNLSLNLKLLNSFSSFDDKNRDNVYHIGFNYFFVGQNNKDYIAPTNYYNTPSNNNYYEPKTNSQSNKEIIEKKEVPKFIAPKIWPTSNITEEDVKSYLDSKKDSLDPIEGIYSHRIITVVNGQSQEATSNYRIAILSRKFLKIDNEKSYDYIAIILESEIEDWTIGRVKSYFRKTAFPNFYECKWFLADYKVEKMDFSFDENGLFVSKNTRSENINGVASEIVDNTILIRNYPLFEIEKNKVPKSVAHENNELKSTGSGFLISKSGLIITNYHVVEEGDHFEIAFPSKNIIKKANVILKDVKNDLAILEVDEFKYNEISKNEIPYTFVENSSVKIGQEVFTLGFPLGEIMGKTARLATGNINSLFGPQDDPRVFQINNPIQPGNSGGGLFNMKGELVGICVSGLNAKFFSDNLGIIPQNMNFAIKASYLKNLIGMMLDADEILNRKNTIKKGSFEELIEQINPFVVQIRVY